MALSKEEIRKLAELEKQFESSARLGGSVTRLRLEHQRAMAILGWTMVTVGSILVLVLLPLSVAASFGCFLVAASGLVLLRGGHSLPSWLTRRQGG